MVTTVTQNTTAQNTDTARTRSYICYYRFTNSPPQFFVFEFKGDLKNAKERANLHCTRMNYKYINTRPFVVDLDAREAARNQSVDHFNEDY